MRAASTDSAQSGFGRRAGVTQQERHMTETDIERLTRERDEAHTRYNALLWQITNEGCVAARVGEGTRECGLPVCGLCRLVHERDFYKQNSAVLGDALRIGNAKLVAAEARAAAAEKERDEAREREERPWEVLAQDWELQADLERAGRVAAEERAASLSRELLDAMQARDSYRADVEALRNEMAARETDDKAIAAGALFAAEAKAERLAKGLRCIRDYEPHEVVKDEFAYSRIVEAYRDAARAALAEVGE